MATTGGGAVVMAGKKQINLKSAKEKSMASEQVIRKCGIEYEEYQK